MPRPSLLLRYASLRFALPKRVRPTFGPTCPLSGAPHGPETVCQTTPRVCRPTVCDPRSGPVFSHQPLRAKRDRLLLTAADSGALRTRSDRRMFEQSTREQVMAWHKKKVAKFSEKAGPRVSLAEHLTLRIPDVRIHGYLVDLNAWVERGSSTDPAPPRLVDDDLEPTSSLISLQN